MSLRSKLRAAATWQVIGLLAFISIACETDTSGPDDVVEREVAVVLNSVERSLTVVPVEDTATSFTIGVGPDGSPASLAVREGIAVVPLGVLPAAAVVDLGQRRVVHNVALPANSGATGVAFLNDSIALVANPTLNTVSPINVLRGTAGTPIEVGVYPQAIVTVDDTAYVLNARLNASFEPDGPGTVTVLAGSPLSAVRTIQLSGLNPGAATVGVGRVYVLHSGRFGMADASLSVIDRSTLTEIAHDEGFGEFPGALASAPDGSLAIAAFAYGVAFWNPATRTFTRSPDNALAPGDIPSTSAVAYDSDGRLYALQPECAVAGKLLRLSATLAVEREVNTGICPLAIGFTRTIVPR